MRVTTDRIPSSNQLQKEIGLPIGVIVKPYGDLPSVRFLCQLLGRGSAHSQLWI